MAILKRMKLGELLLEAGLLTDEQLRIALDEQLKTHRRLGEILVEKKFVDQEALMDFLSKQLKIPRVIVAEVEPDPTALALLPLEYCRKNLVIPLQIEASGKLKLAIADPMNIFLIDEIEHRTGMKVSPCLELAKPLLLHLDKLFSTDSNKMDVMAAELGGRESTGTESADSIDLTKVEGPIVALAHQVIEKGITEKASDIHVEPSEKGLRVRFRVDGVLVELLKIPPTIQKFSNELVSRLKLMANMDISERRLPQDGRIRVAHGERTLDLRVNTIPVSKGEKVCMRILDSSSTRISLKDCGFADHNLKIFEELITNPNGLILVTGPTGSGKTSTLYAALNRVYTPEINICTVEDPVEYQIPEFNQTQLKSSIGLTFGSCLRAILRQDPDVILIGEIRDLETAKIAVESALTGHLVFSTLHTNSASAAVARLIELGVESYMVASTLLGIVAQRLVRRLCPRCKAEEDLAQMVVDFFKDRFQKELVGHKMPKPVGCKSCKDSGYVGRMAIHEILVIDALIRSHILAEADSETITADAKKHGYLTLVEDGYLKVVLGRTTFSEVRRVAR